MPAANFEVNPFKTPAPTVPACTSSLCMAFKKYIDDKEKREQFQTLTVTSGTLLRECERIQNERVGERIANGDASYDVPIDFPPIHGADFSTLPTKCNCGTVAFAVRLYYGERLRAEVDACYPFFETCRQKADAWCQSDECATLFRHFFINFYNSHSGCCDDTADCSCGYLKAFFYPREEPADAEAAQVVPSRKRKDQGKAQRSTRSKK